MGRERAEEADGARGAGGTTGTGTRAFVLWIDSAGPSEGGRPALGGVVEHVATATRRRFRDLGELRSFLEQAFEGDLRSDEGGTS